MKEKAIKLFEIPSWFIKLFASWLFFIFVWTIYLAFRKFPFNARLKITILIAALIYFFVKKGKERIKRNIALIRPDLNKKQINESSFRLAKTIARSWAAIIGNEFTKPEQLVVKVEVQGIERLLKYYKSGEKIIVTVAHIGPIDEMAGIISLFNLKVYVPVEPIKPKWLFKLMQRLRLRIGDIIIEPVERGKTLSRAAHYLKSGRIVILAVDVTRNNGSGVICKIGEAKAKFPVGAVKLALEQEAMIIPVFPSFPNGKKAKLEIGSPFELLKTNNLETDIESNTRRLIENLYAPYIQENYDCWLRLLWSNLEPVNF